MAQSNWLAGDSNEVIDHLDRFHGKSVIWSSNPIAQAWARNTIAYYSNVLEPSSWDTGLVYEGEQGELVRMIVPQARSLVRQLVTLLTKQKLSFRALAERKGSDVVQSMRLGNALADQIVDECKIDLRGQQMCESALVEGMGFLKGTWRTDKGEIWTPDMKGDPLYTGKFEVCHITVFDMLWDYTIDKWEEQDWVECRVKRNRWDLVAHVS